MKEVVVDLKIVIEDKKIKKQQKKFYDSLNVIHERTNVNAQEAKA